MERQGEGRESKREKDRRRNEGDGQKETEGQTMRETERQRQRQTDRHNMYNETEKDNEGHRHVKPYAQ